MKYTKDEIATIRKEANDQAWEAVESWLEANYELVLEKNATRPTDEPYRLGLRQGIYSTYTALIYELRRGR